MFGNQMQQFLRFITAGIDLAHPQHGGDKGKTPAMHMKQGRQRHIDIIGLDPALARNGRKASDDAKAVQHQLAVGIGHPLWVARGACGVKQRRTGGF